MWHVRPLHARCRRPAPLKKRSFCVGGTGRRRRHGGGGARVRQLIAGPSLLPSPSLPQYSRDLAGLGETGSRGPATPCLACYKGGETRRGDQGRGGVANGPARKQGHSVAALPSPSLFRSMPRIGCRYLVDPARIICLF